MLMKRYRWRCTIPRSQDFMACGVAGLSVIADSLSAIQIRRGNSGIRRAVLLKTLKLKGDFPKYGNDDTIGSTQSR